MVPPWDTYNFLADAINVMFLEPEHLHTELEIELQQHETNVNQERMLRRAGFPLYVSCYRSMHV